MEVFMAFGTDNFGNPNGVDSGISTHTGLFGETVYRNNCGETIGTSFKDSFGNISYRDNYGNSCGYSFTNSFGGTTNRDVYGNTIGET